jgi:phosphotriesterase-related protein
MLDAGHEKRLLMSLDSTRARLRSYGGVPGLAYIIANFIPQMREMGVSAYQTGLFFTENPAEVFAHGI